MRLHLLLLTAILTPIGVAAASSLSSPLKQRDTCPTDYTLCAPTGASTENPPSIDNPAIQNLLNDLLSTSLPTFKKREKEKENIKEKAKRLPALTFKRRNPQPPDVNRNPNPNPSPNPKDSKSRTNRTTSRTIRTNQILNENNNDSSPPSTILCCISSLPGGCLLLSTLQIPFCYDKFTTNYHFSDGSYGTLSKASYTTSNNDIINLQTGNYTLANGKTGNIYNSNNNAAAADPDSDSSGRKKTTSTLISLPSQYQASGIGSAIPVDSLGRGITTTITTTYTTIIPATTVQATTLEPSVLSESITTSLAIIPATLTTTVSSNQEVITSTIGIPITIFSTIPATTLGASTIEPTTISERVTVITKTIMMGITSALTSGSTSGSAAASSIVGTDGGSSENGNSNGGNGGHGGTGITVDTSTSPLRSSITEEATGTEARISGTATAATGMAVSTGTSTKSGVVKNGPLSENWIVLLLPTVLIAWVLFMVC